jgi:hypothetical protein
MPSASGVLVTLAEPEVLEVGSMREAHHVLGGLPALAQPTTDGGQPLDFKGNSTNVITGVFFAPSFVSRC